MFVDVADCSAMGMIGASTSGLYVVRRQLGNRLKRLRLEAGKSHEDVAAAQIASPTKMWRIETGQIAVKPGDVWALARLYNLPNDVTDALVNMAQGTRDDGWWEEYGASVPEWLGLYSGLEGVATGVYAYHGELVVGLLQTPDYARAVISTDDSLDEKTIEARVTFRMNRRKTVLERDVPGHVSVVLGAAAMNLVVGSPRVLRAQVEYLQVLSDGGQIDVKILPWSAGAHEAMKGAFTILDFDGSDDPSLIHVDTHVGAKYIERPAPLAEFRAKFDRLCAKSVPIEEYRK